MAPLADPIAHSRRYDLDWLRLIAFGLLIFYHIGMFYVTWGWHVKSAYASPAAEPLMSLLNPWRLALLFFISGVAVRFASDKMRSGAFAVSRLKRLGFPIAFGIFVVVAPQAYFQLLQAGQFEGGYLAFYGEYVKFEQTLATITPTWNHLWYVVYLLTYILVLAPFLKPLGRFAAGKGGEWFGALLGHPIRLLLIVVIPFIAYEALLAPHFPTTHDLVNDWNNHAHRFTIFLFGYFAAKNARFWDVVLRARWLAGGVVLCVGAMILGYSLNPALAENYPLRAATWTVLQTLYAWSAIVLLLALGQLLLNRKSSALSYLTEAIFPYYILHQTIIIVAGFYLTQMALGAWPEFLMLTAITLGGCAVLHEFLIRRVSWLRPLFGLKPKTQLPTPVKV